MKTKQKSSLKVHKLSINLDNNAIFYNIGTIQSRTNILSNGNTAREDSTLGPGGRASGPRPAGPSRPGPLPYRVPGSGERSGLSRLERVRGI